MQLNALQFEEFEEHTGEKIDSLQRVHGKWFKRKHLLYVEISRSGPSSDLFKLFMNMFL